MHYSTFFRVHNYVIEEIQSVCFRNRKIDLKCTVDRFHDILNKFILERVPTLTINTSNKYPHITLLLSSLKNSKSKVFRKYKKIHYTNYSVSRCCLY